MTLTAGTTVVVPLCWGATMPIATPDVYAEMLDRAKAGAFAYPAINVTSSQSLNAALQGFAEAGSDGIVQISTGGAEYLSGQKVKDMVVGAVSLAEFAHHVAKGYSVNIALSHRPLCRGGGAAAGGPGTAVKR
jgi:fructose/tagatose bisphosphate aldolase